MATGDSLDNPLIRQVLESKAPDVSILRQLVIAAYNAENGIPVGAEQTDAKRDDAVARWLRLASISESAYSGFFCSASHLRQVLFDGLESKASWLHQAQCVTCWDYRGLEQPSVLFHIRVDPSSHQAQKASMQRAFRRAVHAALDERQVEHFGESSLCVRLVFLLSPNRRKRLDLDNLTKGTLDALRGRLFDDDSQVQHLDVLKLVGPDDGDQAIGVRIAPTKIDDHSDVFRKTFEVNWAGWQHKRIADFLE